MNVIGISAFFHDSACCLIQDGALIAAAEEERFSRIKADPSLPKSAFRYCLEQGNMTIDDVDRIAYYETPKKKLARQLWSGVYGNPPDLLENLDTQMVEKQIREILGYEGSCQYVDHHLSHAASSFFCSGFEESAILTADGVGEWATTTYGTGTGTRIDLFEEVHFPDSLGLLYSTITSYLGFGVNDGEYKVMGLAPYGHPVYLDKIRQLIEMKEDGQFRLDMRYFAFMALKRMYTEELTSLFGRGPREENDELDQFHMDIARSMQVALEEIMLEKAQYLHKRTGVDDLCLAGGVALNCVVNGAILRKGPYKRLFVQPAANDAGGAIGAAAIAYRDATGDRPLKQKMTHAYLGPAYNSREIHKLLQASSFRYHDLRGRQNEFFTLCATKLREGKVIGWFQGRMEFGPRALGSRSILADARNPGMRDRINAMVKKREGFRPFAPAVPDVMAGQHFDLDHDSPFMLETCMVNSLIDLPSITHVDGSARVQTVHRASNRRFYDLLTSFYELTGCPILLNTSFNIKGEPIVCTPEDAVRCFITTDIDCLVIEDFIIDREHNDLKLLRLLLSKDLPVKSGIEHDVYTFI